MIGAIAGYYSGWIDNLLMRFTDLVLTLPALVVLLTASALWGEGSQWRVTLILTAFFWTSLARVARGIFLSLREKEYVEAAKAAGAGDLRIMFRHILPNTLGPVIVNGTLTVGDRDPGRGRIVLPRLRHQAADAVPRGARLRAGRRTRSSGG